MQVHKLLENVAARSAEKIAVRSREGQVTYGELDLQANRVGNFLKHAGIRRGDRVAIILENSATFIAIYFGVLKAGGIAVPFHTNTDADHLGGLLEHAGAKVIFGSGRLAGMLRSLGKELSAPPLVVTRIADRSGTPADGRTDGSPAELLIEDILSQGADRHPDVRGIDLDLESIVYTSGSTGSPKGVMLSHLNTVSNMSSIVEYFHLTGDDSVMVILPFSYIFGKSLLLTHVMAGGSVVLNNNFMFPNIVLEQMRAFEVTGFAGVPSTFSILLHRSKLRSMEFPALRYMCQAGGGMAPAVQEELARVIAPAQLFIMYGSTEAAPRLTWLDPGMLGTKLGSIGKAIPNVEVFIADENGGRAGPGEEGEIVARGSNIMAGYWRDPERTAEVLRDGLYFTGDLGKEDEEGYFYVTGRKRDFIKVKGFRVSAKEIEEVLLECDQVQEAAVVGAPDEVLGEAARAYVVLKDGQRATEDELRSFLSARLAPPKVPKHIEFRTSLPKNDSGKIMKTALESTDGSRAGSR